MSEEEKSALPIKVLITGASGQLGYALQQTRPTKINGVALDVVAVTRAQLDLSAPDTIATALDQYQPDIIINAAAYTAVDKAESDADLAETINHSAVAELASWCSQQQKMLLQVSTDFVFDGKKSSAYLPTDECNPLGVYGNSKRAAEIAALTLNPRTYIVRTGWVYCEHGANFVKTMLRLGAERESLNVVSDQLGTPTYAINLAKMLWALVAVQPEQKVFHFSDAGTASWYDFACAIFNLAEQKKLLVRQPQLKPIRTRDYPTPAQRPGFSVLDKFQTWETLSISPIHWQQALGEMLDKLVQ